MNTTQPMQVDYEEVRRIVVSWPPTLRVALMRDILDTLPEPAEQTQRRREALLKLRGFLKTDKPAPTDEEVQQWLDEHRMEKYG